MGWAKKHQEGEPAMSEYKPDELRVAVLAGGISDERDISFSSGKNVMAALAEAGYTHVEMLDPADDDFLVKLSEGSYDVAVIALHGRGGEDGMIQSILEYLATHVGCSDRVPIHKRDFSSGQCLGKLIHC